MLAQIKLVAVGPIASTDLLLLLVIEYQSFFLVDRPPSVVDIIVDSIKLVHVVLLRVGESLAMENMIVMIKRSTVINILHLFWYIILFVSKNICFKNLDLGFNTEWKDTHKINC